MIVRPVGIEGRSRSTQATSAVVWHIDRSHPIRPHGGPSVGFLFGLLLTLAAGYVASCLARPCYSDGAIDPQGFDGISFGTHKQVVVAAVAKKLGMTEKGYASSPTYWSPEWIDMYDRDSAVLITNYKEGRRRYDVTLFFNRNSKFCGFTMKARSRSARRSPRRQRGDLVRLSQVLQDVSRAQSIQLAFCGRELKNAGAGAMVSGNTGYVVVASMLPKDAEKGHRSRLIPVGGVWDKQIRAEPRLPYRIVFTPEQLEAEVDACFSDHDRQEMARTTYVW